MLRPNCVKYWKCEHLQECPCCSCLFSDVHKQISRSWTSKAAISRCPHHIWESSPVGSNRCMLGATFAGWLVQWPCSSANWPSKTAASALTCWRSAMQKAKPDCFETFHSKWIESCVLSCIIPVKICCNEGGSVAKSPVVLYSQNVLKC